MEEFSEPTVMDSKRKTGPKGTSSRIRKTADAFNMSMQRAKELGLEVSVKLDLDEQELIIEEIRFEQTL